ncbi:MAG TPA: hypothetical protein DEP72_02835 [Clostridiales bacterium]|nr:MAG: hypothetical protein A2Y18_01095 [Clostridiales bacterium GWD2_32_19]HCC07090.1 hypothetical protein [Clostridiales bacterium]
MMNNNDNKKAISELSDLMDEMSKAYEIYNDFKFSMVTGMSVMSDYDYENIFCVKLMQDFNKILDLLGAPKELKSQPDIMYECFHFFDFSHKNSSKNIYKDEKGSLVIGRTYKEDESNPYLGIHNVEFEIFVVDNKLVTVHSIKENENKPEKSIHVDKYKSDEKMGYEISQVSIVPCDGRNTDLLTVKNSKIYENPRSAFVPRIQSISTHRELAMRTADFSIELLTCEPDKFYIEVEEKIMDIQQETEDILS